VSVQVVSVLAVSIVGCTAWLSFEEAGEVRAADGGREAPGDEPGPDAGPGLRRRRRARGLEPEAQVGDAVEAAADVTPCTRQKQRHRQEITCSAGNETDFRDVVWHWP